MSWLNEGLPQSDFLAPTTIADLLDVNDSVVRGWIKGGELHPVKIDGWERVPRRDFESFLRRKLATP
jgi:hypothetical protein